MRRWTAPLIAVAAALALWELLVRTGLLSDSSFPAMTDTFGRLFEELGSATSGRAVADTLQGWALGLGIAILLAVPAGMLVGSSRLLYRALRVPIEFLRPIPSVALIPLAVLVYGTGLQSKVFLAAFASFWPLFVQTLYGDPGRRPGRSTTPRARSASPAWSGCAASRCPARCPTSPPASASPPPSR